MDELELRHAEAHYAEMPRDGYSGRCEMLLPRICAACACWTWDAERARARTSWLIGWGRTGSCWASTLPPLAWPGAEATAAAARAEGAAWAERLAFARGCFEGLRAAGVEDASFDVVIVNSVLNLAWDLEGALRETARVLRRTASSTMRACSRTSRFRPPPCRRLRARATCSAPLALKPNSPASPWIALASPCALSSASAPSNLTAPTSPKS